MVKAYNNTAIENIFKDIIINRKKILLCRPFMQKCSPIFLTSRVDEAISKFTLTHAAPCEQLDEILILCDACRILHHFL